jgi:hypothetical protein
MDKTQKEVSVAVWTLETTHYFQIQDESPFALSASGSGGDTSCAIMTATPNELLATIHDLICTNSVKAG